MGHRLKQRVHKDAIIERMEPETDGTERIRITTAAKDRDGDIIELDGWDTANYMENPVVLWGHNSHGYTGMSGGVPIGTTHRLETDGAAYIAAFSFREPANDSDFVNIVRSAWRQGVLRAASVGFIPREWEPLSEDADEFWGPFRITRAELLEWSIVPIPANQEALRLAYESVLVSAGIPADAFPQPQPAPASARINAHNELDAALAQMERRIQHIKASLETKQHAR